MNDRELLQQALDALEESVDTVRHEYETDWRHKMPTRKAQLDGIKNLVEQHKSTITALQNRLAHCDRCGKRLGGEGDIHTCSPRLDQGPDYERGFVDGMSRQAQSSVDRAVNRMAQPEQEYVATVQCIKGITIDPVTGNVGIGTPAQPEKEPVAWGVFDGPNLHDMFFSEEDAQDMARLKGVGSVVRPLTTPPAQLAPVPKGWKMVPVEPTREMWTAVNKLDDQCAAGNYDGKGCSIEQAWNCLLDAAPTPPAAQRQWVSLTDKQMVDAIEPLYQNRATAEMAAKVSMDEFRAIEAKLKEKYMKAVIEVDDCRDCPFAHDHRGHGECWKECRHPQHKQGAYENILWGCQEKFKATPSWCPLKERNT